MRLLKILVLVFVFLVIGASVYGTEVPFNYGLTITVGSPQGTGFVGGNFEATYKGISTILGIKLWNIYEDIFDQNTLDLVDESYWRTYFSLGMRKYIAPVNYGPYIQGTFDVGLEFNYDESDEAQPENETNFIKSRSPEGFLFSVGMKKIIFNRLILDISISAPIEMIWPFEQTITNQYLPSMNMGIGVSF